MQLAYLEPDEPFPPLGHALGPGSAAPGLLCAGADLSVDRLVEAYSQGIFPWFSEGQPILWWSPDPRMVLRTGAFKLHPSMRKTLKQWTRESMQENPHEIRIDHDFAAVIGHCSAMRRKGQRGTWIVPEMVQAYIALHRAGRAHSVEAWCGGELIGGLYCVNLGGMVFGESMFSLQPNASKFALCALVAFCREHALPLIDCQQNTAHLASLGATETPRNHFMQQVSAQLARPFPRWTFAPSMWQHLFSDTVNAAPSNIR
jgi:leucyl/phenylalanyl-tRNA---protein transferase